MGKTEILVKIVWGILVGLIMVITYKQVEVLMIIWGVHTYITIIIAGMVSYLTTYITRNLINKAF